MHLLNIVRRIRACEGEAAALVVLEHAIKKDRLEKLERLAVVVAKLRKLDHFVITGDTMELIEINTKIDNLLQELKADKVKGD